MAMSAWRISSGHVDLFVRVTPNASRDAIEGIDIRDDGRARLGIRVRAVPEKGKANKAVITIVAKALGVAKSSVTIAAGGAARDKTLRIDGVPGVGEALAALTPRRQTLTKERQERE
jgi:uncharacterized protein (TIGR00251 family)